MAKKAADDTKTVHEAADRAEHVDAPEPDYNPAVDGPPVGPEQISGLDPVNPAESEPLDPEHLSKKDKVLTMRNHQTGEERKVRQSHWDMDEKALTAHGWRLES